MLRTGVYERPAGYAAIGCRARTEGIPGGITEIILDTATFLPGYKNGLLNTVPEIIMSPFFTKKRVLQMLPFLLADAVLEHFDLYHGHIAHALFRKTASIFSMIWHVPYEFVKSMDSVCAVGMSAADMSLNVFKTRLDFIATESPNLSQCFL